MGANSRGTTPADPILPAGIHRSASDACVSVASVAQTSWPSLSLAPAVAAVPAVAASPSIPAHNIKTCNKVLK